jgi:CDP-paratose 2-epimerase
MRVLVTGGAGMIGSHCAEHFAADGRNSVAVYDNLMRSRLFASREKSVEHCWRLLHRHRNVEFWENDIRDVGALDACFDRFRPDVVIHAAGQPGVRFSLDNAREDFSINCEGTVNVLEALRRRNPAGVFIYCSTNKVYGERVNALPTRRAGTTAAARGFVGIDESHSIDHTGHTPYGVSKLAGDLYVQEYAHTYGIKTGVFRLSCVYGTRQFGFEDQGWVAWFALCAVLGEPITIFGDGRQVRDVLWVGDLVDACERFIASPIGHGVFNVGGGAENTLSLLELISVLEEITGSKIAVTFEEARKLDQNIYVSDITKIRSALAWQPVVAPRDGVARLVRWIQENRALFGRA